MKVTMYFTPPMDMSSDSQTSERTKFKMHLFLTIDLLNFNLYYLLVT